MQHDWFMYHLRSTYKNRLDFPFKDQRYNDKWFLKNFYQNLFYEKYSKVYQIYIFVNTKYTGSFPQICVLFERGYSK